MPRTNEASFFMKKLLTNLYPQLLFAVILAYDIIQ